MCESITNNTDTAKSSRRIQIGQIVGFHGIKGAVKIKTENADPDWLDDLETVYLQPQPNQWQPLTITQAFQKSPTVIVATFKEIKDRTEAEQKLNQQWVYADEADLPELDAGEFLIDELVGLTVIDEATKATIGNVKDLVSSSNGQQFLDIELQDANHEKDAILTVPFNEHFFPVVDIEAGTITGRQLSDLIALS